MGIKLRWFGSQVRKIAAKAKKRLNLLQCIAGAIWDSCVRTLKTRFCSIVHPVLEYASSVWSHPALRNLAKINVVQSAAVHTIKEL